MRVVQKQGLDATPDDPQTAGYAQGLRRAMLASMNDAPSPADVETVCNMEPVHATRRGRA
jgi:hypothetical protein